MVNANVCLCILYKNKVWYKNKAAYMIVFVVTKRNMH